jgi:hypothetical protein
LSLSNVTYCLYFSSFLLYFILDKVTGLSAAGEAKLRWKKDQTQYKQAKQQERYGMVWYGWYDMLRNTV